MNASTVQADRYLAQFEQLAPSLAGHSVTWLRALRDRGLAEFASRGFPSSRDEDWKYTRIAPIERRAFSVASPVRLPVDRGKLNMLAAPSVDCHRLVLVNGSYVADLSDPVALPAGLTAGSLAQALEADPGALEPYLGRRAEVAQAGSFAALNTAFLSDGAFVHLRRGTVVERPLEILHLSLAGGTELVSYPRILIVAEEGSQIQVIERYLGEPDSLYFTNAVTEVYVQPHASVEHFKIVQESEKAFHVAGIHVQQEAHSRYTSHSHSFGGLLVRNDLWSALDAVGAECTLNGLYLAGGRQHVDNHTRVDHLQPHGTSRELYRGVLDGHGRAVFNGRVVVHKDAQRTDAEQSNKNLLLSREAEVDTKPQLEIFADDVKCAHGATVGQIDENEIFYLRSRGIGDQAARSLLTYAFAHEVIDRVRTKSIQTLLSRLLQERLPHAGQIGDLDL